MIQSKFPLHPSERRALLLAMDLFLLNSAVVAARWLYPVTPITALFTNTLSWFIVASGIWLVLAYLNDLYDIEIAADLRKCWTGVLWTLVVSIVLHFSIYFLCGKGLMPRRVIALYLSMAYAALFLWRLAYTRVFTLPYFRRRVFIIGAGKTGETLAKAMRLHPRAGYQPVGFIDGDPAKQKQTVENLPVLGGHAELPNLIREKGISEVVLAIKHELRGAMFQTLIDVSDLQGVQITPMTELYELLTGRVAIEHIGQNWLLDLPLQNTGAFDLYPLIKRVIDIGVSVAGLILLFPLLPFIALAIYFDSRGAVFYSQTRLGRYGKEFRLWKFRTMIPNAESTGTAQWATENDPRVTRVGKFLRRMRIDELPQLWNILRGDMSLIGPRPERPEFIAQLEAQIPFYRSRLRVRPGLTGWAQVKYHYGNTIEDALVKLQYDLYYIKNQSLYLDLLILWKTVGVVLSGKGT